MEAFQNSLPFESNRVEIGLCRLVRAKVAKSILAAHEHRRIQVMFGLAHLGRNELDIQSNPSIRAVVRH